jgi:hypothetical protein
MGAGLTTDDTDDTDDTDQSGRSSISKKNLSYSDPCYPRNQWLNFSSDKEWQAAQPICSRITRMNANRDRISDTLNPPDNH